MVKVHDLSFGWTLFGDPATGLPWMKNKDGRWRKPAEMAYAPEFRTLYREVKHVLDVMDVSWRLPGNELRWKAADIAKYSMEFTLKAVGRWSDELPKTRFDLKEAA